MNNKIVPTFYRIFVILTFICGTIMIFWFGKFAVYAIEDADPTDIKVAQCMGNYGMFFFAFLMMVFICFVLSIVCFRASRVISSIFRTLFTAIAGGICIPAVKFMLILIDMERRYVDNIGNLNYLDEIDLEKNIYLMFVTLPAYSIMMVLFITSAIALATGPIVRNEQEKTEPEAAEKKTEQKGSGRKRFTDEPAEESKPKDEKVKGSKK